MGLSKASNDNANFKMALYAVITNLVASLINSALSGVVAVLFDVISWIALLATVYYVIKGVSELLPNSALAVKGKAIANIAIVAVGLEIIADVLSFTSLYPDLVFMTFICMIVFYIMYLGFLSKSRMEL